MSGKRQHFVPQHYLRQFRIAGKNQIVVAQVEPFKLIGPGGIRHQCKQDYFYEEDIVDDAMSRLETDLAPALIRVARSGSFDSKDRISLDFLAASLHLRTRKAVETAKLFPKHIANEFVKYQLETGKLPAPKGGFKEDMIDFKGVPGFLFMNTLLPAVMEMRTLACKLLMAAPKRAFITSDNPVALLNQLFMNSDPNRSFAGFSRSGFQLVLPINPALCLFFFDPKVYAVGSSSHQVTRLCKRDVEIVNSLQIQNAEKCLYFHAVSEGQGVEQLTARYGPLRALLKDALRTFDGPKEGETFIHVRNQSPAMPNVWNCCRIRRDPRIGLNRRRDPEWTDFVTHVIEEMEQDPEGANTMRSVERVLGFSPDEKY